MTVTVYKLTTQDDTTYGSTKWGPGVTHSGTGQGALCSPGYIHAYLSPALAVLLNPIHGGIPNPKLWECSVSAIALSDRGLKVGAVTLTTIREISKPEVTPRHRVIFAILCAERAAEITKPFVVGDSPWQVTYRARMGEFWAWAEAYKADAADAAASAAADAAASAAARAAARAADAAASYAARAASYAARAASYAARAADAAARADADAADAAARAASYAARDEQFNIVELADRALTYPG